MVTVKMNTSALRAKTIYDRLMSLPRDGSLSNNEWAKKAGVNTSFFTNLKNGSEPSIGNLRAVLAAANVSIPEFFASEAEGRLIPAPSKDFLEAAIREVLPGLPRNQDKRAEYLAEALLHALELHPDHLSNIVTLDFRDLAEKRKAAEAPCSTSSAESSLPRTG